MPTKTTNKNKVNIVSKPLIVLVLALYLLLHIGFVAGANDDCFQGVDGVCDENCLDVDFDCIDNPNQEGYLTDWNELFAEDTSVGVSDEQSNKDPNKDDKRTPKEDELEEKNLSQKNVEEELKQTQQEDEIGDYRKEIIIPENKVLPDEYIEIEHKKRSKAYQLIIPISLILLSYSLFLLFKRLTKSLKEYDRHKTLLLDYIIELRSKKYSDDQIKQYFYSRGYKKDYVEGLFKDLA